MSSETERAPVSAICRCTARETSSRGASSSTKRSPEASSSRAPSPRIASVTRNPSRPWRPTTAVGWNWTSSRSASWRRRRGPAAFRCRARPADWWCAPRAPPRRRSQITVAPAAIRRPSSQLDADAAPVLDQQRVAALPSSTSTIGSSAASAESWRIDSPAGGGCRRHARPAAPSARPRARARAARRGRRRTSTPSRARSSTARRRLGAEHPGGGLANRAATGRDRVGEVALRAVAGARARPRARPAPSTRGLGERGRRDRARPPRPGGRRTARCRARLRRLRRRRARLRADVHMRGYGTRDGDASSSSHPTLARATTPVVTPSSRRGSRRSSASSSGGTGSGSSASSSPRGRPRRCSSAVHPDGYVAVDRAPVRARRRRDRRRHRRQRRLVGGGAARRRRRGRGSSSCCSTARRTGVQRPPAAGPSRAAGARDGLLPVQQRRARGAVRARPARVSSG